MRVRLGTDVSRLVGVARARRWLIVEMVIVATGLGLVGSLAQPSRYTASADLLFGRTTNSDAIVAEGATDTAVAPDREAATNLALASLDRVAERVKQRLGGSATADEIRRAVTIEAHGTSDVVTVTVEWSGREESAAVANAFASEIVAQRRKAERTDIQQAIDALQVTGRRDKLAALEYLKARADGNVHLVERATPPEHSSSPAPVRSAVIAGLLAAILSLVVIALLARFDDRIRDESQLAELMETSLLTRVPAVERTPHAARAFLESFDFLRLSLQLMKHEGDGLILAVTSPGRSEGKTMVVRWLARALMRSGDEVASVDRHPELRAGLIAGGRLRQAFEELAWDADWVLVDTVPISTAAHATAVVAAADGVILVVDIERARRRDLLAAKRQLANARAKLLGIVVNRAAVDFPVNRHADKQSLDDASFRHDDGEMRGARTAVR